MFGNKHPMVRTFACSIEPYIILHIHHVHIILIKGPPPIGALRSNILMKFSVFAAEKTLYIAWSCSRNAAPFSVFEIGTIQHSVSKNLRLRYY